MTDEQATELWDRLIDSFKQKEVKAAHEFLNYAAKIGLAPLQEESERLFWSGKKSREHVYAISKFPPEQTALEKTDIGRLLDKLSVFEAVDWDLSTLVWALVSKLFGIGATGDVHAYLDGGFALHNVFWNDELPGLRLMQRYGAVQNIWIHIWDSKKEEWQPRLSIDSDELRLVFDKAKRIPAPTPDKPEATRSFVLDPPVKVATLRRQIFERHLQSKAKFEKFVDRKRFEELAERADSDGKTPARPPLPRRKDGHRRDGAAHPRGAGGPAQRARGRGAQGAPRRRRERHGRVRQSARHRTVLDSPIQGFLGAAGNVGAPSGPHL